MKFYAAYLYADFDLSTSAAGEQSASFNFAAKAAAPCSRGQSTYSAYSRRVGKARVFAFGAQNGASLQMDVAKRGLCFSAI